MVLHSYFVETLSLLFSSIHKKDTEKLHSLLEESSLPPEAKISLLIYGQEGKEEASSTSQQKFSIIDPKAMVLTNFITKKEFNGTSGMDLKAVELKFGVSLTSLIHVRFLFSEALMFMGIHQIRSSDLDKAELLLQEAIRWKETVSDIHGVGLINNILGVVSIHQGNLDQALMLFKRAVSRLVRVEDFANLGLVYNNMGGVLFSQGNLQLARVQYNEGLKYAHQVQNVDLKGKLFNNLGILHFERAEFRDALEYYEQSLHLKEMVNDSAGMAPTLHNIGKIHGKQGDYFLALKYLEKSLECCPSDDPTLKANTLGEIIYYRVGLDEYEKARSYLLMLEELKETVQLPIIDQYYLLSEVIILKGSSLTGYHLDAIRKLETIIEGPMLHIEITRTAILHYLDLKMDSIRPLTRHNLRELEYTLYLLYKITQEYGSRYELVESMLLLSKYCRMIGENEKGIWLLEQAALMSVEHDFPALVKKCDNIPIGSEYTLESEFVKLKEELISVLHVLS